ncbi:MAG TPA: YncE family protein [Gemmatimonadales bacterium]|nr:YncE family protein [Gemmatimonadales bacterium]
MRPPRGRAGPLLALGAAAAAAALLGGCRGPNDFVLYRPPKSVSLSPSDTTIVEGQSFRLRAATLDSLGDTVTEVPPVLRNTDTTVLRLSSDGVVTGVGVGVGSVTADAEAVEARALVTVTDSALVARRAVPGEPYDIAIGASTAYVAALEDLVPLSLDSLTVGPAAQGSLGAPVEVEFDTTGRKAYVGNGQGPHVAIVDPGANAEVDSINTGAATVPVCVLGGALFAGTTAGFVIRIDLASKQTTDSIAVPGIAYHLLADRADGLVFAAAWDAYSGVGDVVEADAGTLAPVRTVQLVGRPEAMVLSPDRQTLYVANDAATSLVGVSLATGAVTQTIPLASPAFGLAISPDGTRLYASQLDGTVVALDRATGAVVRHVIVGGNPREVRYDAAHARVLAANEDGWVDVLKP